MSKRKNKSSLNYGKNVKKQNIAQQIVNEYSGYHPQTNDAQVDLQNYSGLNSQKFYDNYIKLRRPVVMNGVISDLNIDEFKPDVIVDKVKSDELLLVEKKFKGGFGSGTQRVKMKFAEFMEKLMDPREGDDYYLTTQYHEDDPDEIDEIFNHDEDDDGEEEEDDEEDEDDDYGRVPSSLDVVKEDDDEDFESDKGIALPDFSDTDSIDFNNIHDDFDDLSDPEHETKNTSNDIVSDKFPEDPLGKDEALRRVHELVQKPLTNLIKTESFPLLPDLMKSLVPQQVNIWIGSSAPTTTLSQEEEEQQVNIDETQEDLGLGRRLIGGGSSSGLHHDHADNLYIPIKGFKRFTIFAPSEAPNLYTVGNINRVYDSGVIDYKNDENALGWRHLRNDGAILTEVGKFKLNDPADSLNDSEVKGWKRLIEEEENMLSKLDQQILFENNDDDADTNRIKKDPPSFSRIPPLLIHLNKIRSPNLRNRLTKLTMEKFPNLFKTKKIIIDLKPGQMLYLPAGWFHEVTSFGEEPQDQEDGSKVHIALNYWYAPPNHAEKVYCDDYWRKDFERTLESVSYYKSL